MQSSQIICSQCGKANPAGAKFCFACGTALTASQAPVPPPPPSSNFITLTCPQCGGKLQAAPDAERALCVNCGAEHLIQRGGGILTLQPLIHAAQQARVQSESVRDVTGQILQDVAGSHQSVWQQAGTYEDSTRRTAVNQEILTIRKELDDLKPRYKVLHSKDSAWVMTLLLVFFAGWMIISPPEGGMGGFVYILGGILVFSFIVVVIIMPFSTRKMKLRIDELEARMKYLEQIK